MLIIFYMSILKEESLEKNQINTSSMFSHKPNGCKGEFSRFSYMVLSYLYTTY